MNVLLVIVSTFSRIQCTSVQYSVIIVQGVNSAADIVKYCQSKPMFREVNMKRYLAASTTKRVFHHVTRAQVETPESLRLFKSRTVSTYEGMIMQGKYFCSAPNLFLL